VTRKRARQHFTLEPYDVGRLECLYGENAINILLLEGHLGVEITSDGNKFVVIGLPKSIASAESIIRSLYEQTESELPIKKEQVLMHMNTVLSSSEAKPKTKKKFYGASIKIGEKSISPRTPNQEHYMESLSNFDVNFGIGPSGSGKTFLAVASALAAYDAGHVSRIMLCRPAVEAGEKLGFLPGDINEKISPYLQPLYDALYNLYGVSKVERLLSTGVLEIVPLAFMRGRTLSDAFIILDEAQNTTVQQMKMFLTRMGFQSRMVITGDVTQTDLPNREDSGLRHVMHLLQEIDGVEFTFFKTNDIVRHPLVQQIIEAYEEEDP
jgi:phosphate starvation-inducible protein PhoH and related proteins